jgi:sensor histidine kinase YesM
VDSSVSESCKIPPLLLQPFVENAILHGLKNKVTAQLCTEPEALEALNMLSITFSMQHAMLHITITDNGIGRKAAAELKTQTTTTHASKGIAITTQRIIALSTKNMLASVTIVDNTDDNGVAVGTSVHIQLPVMV